MSAPCRFGILASHPIQYFTPVYRRLAATPGLDVEVLYCRDFGVRERFDKQFGRAIRWDTDQLGGYRHRFLRNLSPIGDTFNPLHAINPGAFAAALRGYDALWMNGYLYPSNWLALAGAAARRTKVLLRSELWLDPARPARRFDAVRDRIIRWWIRRADALLYIGEANRQAYEAFGARPEQLFFSPYSIDVERVQRSVPRTAHERRELRRALGLDVDAPMVLYVGKLTERKHPEVMLHVAHELPQATVVLVGSGPMEEDLRAAAEAAGLTNVRFEGFVNQSGLPRFYGAADVFVMPSEREPWGLVLNEAMAAGLSAVVTDQVGAAADLILEGETGFTVSPGAWDRLVTRVRALLEDAELRGRMGAAARARAEGYGYDQTTAGILEALIALEVFEPSHESRSTEVECASAS